MLLTDGSAGDQQEVIRGTYGVSGAAVPLVGGWAGGDRDDQRAFLVKDGTPTKAPVVAAALGSCGPMGIGVRHGWRKVGEPMLVTHSEGHQVHKLDDRPALAVYLDRLGAPADARVDRLAFRQFVLTHPLGLSRRGAIPDFAAAGTLRAAMAAPVHEHGDVVGSLGVGTREPGRSYSKAEQEILMAERVIAALVLFQPIVELRTGGTVSAEALVRWAHPGRGLVSPGAFIPLAEETGLIMPFGRFVLDRACAQAAHWRHTFPVPVAVNVNLSARQLQDPGLVDHVGAALARHDLEASALVLEVTETVLVQEAEVALDRLADLRALGVGLALDDFGTGYSSLRYLSQLPVDVLKVDKCFVDGLGSPRGHTALVRAVVEMAGSLDLRVVAEGIERADQSAALVDLGCELGQGFHFAHPLDAVAMADRLLAEASRSVAADALPLAA